MSLVLPQTSAQWRGIAMGGATFVAAAGLVYLLVTLSPPGTPAPVARQEPSAPTPPAAQPASRDTIALVKAGIASPLVNGNDTPIAGSLVAALTVSPGNARYSREVDVFVQDLAAGSPEVSGATVQVTGRMRYMDHGTFRQVAQPTGAGHYRLIIQLPMPGEWDLELQIAAASQRGELRLNMDLYD